MIPARMCLIASICRRREDFNAYALMMALGDWLEYR